jgi:hypothetical protein
MDARTTRRQIIAFSLAILACLGFFVWLLGPWGPKIVEPYSHPVDAPSIKMETHISPGYECLRVYQGEKELHWQCFQEQP